MNYGTHIFCMRWVPKSLRSSGNSFNQVSSAFVHLLLADLSGSAVKTLLVLSELQGSNAPHYVRSTKSRIRKLAGLSQHTLDKSLEELQRAGLIRVDPKGILLQVLKTEELGALHPGFSSCWRCGLDERDLLEPYYFDGNARNKEKENVCFLCPTCIALVQRDGNVRKSEDSWAVNSPKTMEQKVLPKVAENAMNVAENATLDSEKCSHYKKGKKFEAGGGKEKAPQPAGFVGDTNDYHIEPVEEPRIVRSTSQRSEFEIYQMVRDCKNNLEAQLLLAGEIGNPLPGRSFFKKMSYPETYSPLWVPADHKPLFARTILLQATNLMCKVQLMCDKNVVVLPTTPTEVAQLGDTLSAFLRNPNWTPAFREYLDWVAINKTNWSANLLGYYVGDWQKASAK